jgi:hypothetical protein
MYAGVVQRYRPRAVYDIALLVYPVRAGDLVRFGPGPVQLALVVEPGDHLRARPSCFCVGCIHQPRMRDGSITLPRNFCSMLCEGKLRLVLLIAPRSSCSAKARTAFVRRGVVTMSFETMRFLDNLMAISSETILRPGVGPGVWSCRAITPAGTVGKTPMTTGWAAAGIIEERLANVTVSVRIAARTRPAAAREPELSGL